MWENITEPDKPQMTIQRMRIPSWITKATDTHSEYVTVLVFRGNNGYAKVSQCFIIRTSTLSLLLVLMLVIVISYYLFPNPFFLMQGNFRAYSRSRIHVH
jgi:hypothetical protein